jgi:hypothetical protein
MHRYRGSAIFLSMKWITVIALLFGLVGTLKSGDIEPFDPGHPPSLQRGKKYKLVMVKKLNPWGSDVLR